MMKDAKHGAFEVIVLWAIERFGRSTVGHLGDVLELEQRRLQRILRTIAGFNASHDGRRYAVMAV